MWTFEELRAAVPELEVVEAEVAAMTDVQRRDPQTYPALKRRLDPLVGWGNPDPRIGDSCAFEVAIRHFDEMGVGS